MQITFGKYIEDFGNDWFWLATAGVEIAFARCLPALNELSQPEIGNFGAAVEHLKLIAATIADMATALKRMDENLDPVVFYRDFRPYLCGYTGKPFEKKGGLIFEGVSEHPWKLKGGSSAQSPAVHALDRVLGIRHPPAEQEFLDETLNDCIFFNNFLITKKLQTI